MPTYFNLYYELKINKILNSKTAKYTFLSSLCGTSTKTDHVLGHKTCLNIFKFKEWKLYKVCVEAMRELSDKSITKIVRNPKIFGN